VLCLRDFVSFDDIENALYGREVVQIPIGPDGGPAGDSYVTRDFRGLWQQGQTPRYTRVSGVIGAVGVAPWSVASSSLSLWKNPWSTHPLTIDLPWRTVEGDLDANRLVVRDAAQATHMALLLPRPALVSTRATSWPTAAAADASARFRKRGGRRDLGIHVHIA
jgi:hypothetical protein